ncbi:hypothetical protein F443_18432 [Phytophthora nicotianae P1569]|uniref:Uncharacterized protein n=1 Tax=Phytophthora nicotianae P1569 TaxID=1317065 RepID=V9E7W6_PHYNI|nr:hypothetical protein F443_18432 [Phytophthora nicotianae P1569]
MGLFSDDGVNAYLEDPEGPRSLRHVSACIRPAKPFFQRLATLWRRSPRDRTITLTRDAELDFTWFEHILRFSRLRGVPLEFFSDLPDPNVHLYMDASDLGLCVLHPARRKFIRILFGDEDKVLIQQDKFSINLKEQLSAVLAVLCRGGQWSSHDRASLNHVQVPVSVRKAYDASWSLFSNTPLQMPLDGNMSKHGDNGKTSVNCWDDLHGCQKPFPKHNLFNWCCLPSLGGHPFPRALNTLDQNPPFAPSLAMSSGIIASSPDLNRLSPLDSPPRL